MISNCICADSGFFEIKELKGVSFLCTLTYHSQVACFITFVTRNILVSTLWLVLPHL